MNSSIQSININSPFDLYRKRIRLENENDTCSNVDEFPKLKRPKFNDFNIRNYWISLGLIKSQCAAPKLINPTEENIKNDIYHRNSLFFSSYESKLVDLPIWCIDGTCATGKSSSVGRIFKTNKKLNLFGINTHPYSAIGYFYSSLKLLSDKSHLGIVGDRTPYNNLFPWISIWMMIATMNKETYKKTKNSYSLEFTNEEFDAILNVFDDYLLNRFKNFMELWPDNVLNNFINVSKTILVVDSDELIVKTRLANRNTDSDLERSNWQFYITLQNFAYAYMALKFPHNFLIIDINRYDHKLDEIHNIINEIVNIPVPIKNNAIQFKSIEPTNPFAITSKNFQRLERTRPMRYRQFYTNIKNLEHI